MSEADVIKPEVKAAGEYDRDFLELIKLVLLELRTHSPFLGIMASEMWIAGPADNIPTIGVSPRGVVVYNEEFMKKMPLGQVIAVLIHESLHVALDYWKRFEGCNMEIANWAHDFAINDIIVKSSNNMVITKKDGTRFNFKVELPKGGLWDKAYEQMSGEEIYNKLFQEVAEKAKGIRQQIEDQMKDPAVREAMRRQQAIEKELRKSMAEGAKRIQEKKNDALGRVKHTPKTAEDVAAEERAFAAEAFRQGDSFSLEHGAHDEPEETQAPEKGDGDSTQNTQPSEAGDQNSPQQNQPSAFDSAKDQMNQNMMESFKDYMGKERERIESEYDEQPNGTSRDQHLDELSEKLDQAADQYRNDVKEGKEQQEKAEQGQEQGQDGQDGQQQPGDSGDKGQPSDQSGQNPGEGGQDGQQPGQQPGQQSGQSGQGGQQPGQNGQPSSQGGQGGQQPGDGQSPGQGGQASGQDNQGGQGQGQGQGGQAPTERQQEQNVADALDNLLNEASNALNGKPNNMGMTSGEQMANKGAFDEALRQVADQLGVGDMQGDVKMDCSDIKGNPYAKEDKEQTKERHRQMLQRAVVEDAQQGGQGWGSMPSWAKREIEGILNPPLSFTRRMKKFIGSFGRPDLRTFKRRNKRNSYEEHRVIFPGVKRNQAKVYILMDTSGSMMNSMDMDTLRRAMGLVKRLSTSLGLEVLVVQCDAGLTKVMDTKQAMAEIQNKRFDVVGQGGSDFTEGFEFIWKEMKDTDMGFGSPIIVFTDGGITVPEMPPKHQKMQVLWVTNPGQHPPTTRWGQHIVMDDMGERQMSH